MERDLTVEAAQGRKGGLVLADALTPDSLQGIVRGEVDVIRDRAFHPPALCREAMPHIRAACERSTYTLTTDLESLGTSVGEAAESFENAQRYYETALATTELIRGNLFRDRPSPLDRLRV